MAAKNSKSKNKGQNIVSPPHRGLILCITYLTVIATIWLKLFSFGWLTLLIFLMGQVLLIQAILIIVAGHSFAKVQNKDRKGYGLFAAMCTTSILFALLFQDVGDAAGEIGLAFGNADLAFLSLVASIALAIVLIAYAKRKKNN